MPQLLRIFCLFIFLLSVLPAKPLYAQHILDQKITVTVNHKPIQQALKAISETGNFYFSYNSNLIPGDSIVNIKAQQKPVREILQLLLGHSYEYRESGNYVIIQKFAANGKIFTISGYVINKETGEKIPNASVYENRQLTTTLTDSRGYFQLRLRNKFPEAFISVSKINYNDTLYQLRPGYDQMLTIEISPIRTVLLKPVTITQYSKMEATWYGKFLISSRQKIRDINLSRFLVNQPFQSSLWPGAGSHGKLSAQVVNKFSLNILGGYSAGVDGVEVGGLFNIDKNNVQYTQVAGLFNAVGGKMEGAQAAGIYNSVLGAVEGVQIAGISNASHKEVTGIQISGVVNKAERITGVQIGGIENRSTTEVNGLQIAGIFNYTKDLKGFQIGLVNISDTSSGYSLGLINIVKQNGYYKLSLSWNDALDINVAFKTGNKKLYNILLTGANLRKGQHAFSFGYGIGREFPLSESLAFTTEITEQSIYIAHENNIPLLLRIQPSLQVRLGKKIALFAGPSFSTYFPGASPLKHNPIPIPARHISLWNSVTGWFGAQAGITFF